MGILFDYTFYGNEKMKLTLLIIPLVLFSCRCSSEKSGKTTRVTPQEKKQTEEKPERVYVIKDLLKTAVTLKGYWRESDVFSDDEKNWHCSGTITGYKNNRLKIMTNAHCSGLESLLKSDPVAGGPEVMDYSLMVMIHGGARIKGEKIEINTTLDIAVIYTAETELKPGKDFELPPGFGEVEIGDSVLAIGSPVDPKYSGTVTFGRVSALRDRFIQHDAALNPGNSGGPLYRQTGHKFFLTGINTWKLTGKGFTGPKLEGLNFAVKYSETGSGTWISGNINPSGACRLIKGIYSKPCSVK